MIWVSPMLPKFTHRESLTPEPPNLIGAMEPHISQCDTGLTSPNQKWMYDCLSDLIIMDVGGRSTTLVPVKELSQFQVFLQEYQVFCLSLHDTDLYHSKSTHHCQIGKHTHHQFSLFGQDTL